MDGGASSPAGRRRVFLRADGASGGRVFGGVLIRTRRDIPGDIIGAVGISGDTSDKDEACALAGIAAAGLKADTGDPA
jgi:hypothetical protein